jgi:hypothetical protein
MPKLTKRFLDDLKPEPARGDQTHWDDSLKGFGVRVWASGAMSWVIMCRNRDNRLRKYTIGQVGALTPDEARNEARQKLADAHRGLDPSADKGAQRKAMTVTALCEQYQEYSKGRVKDSTWNMDQSRIDCHVKPLLGSRKAESLKLADIENLQRDVAAGKSAKAIKRQGRGGTARGGRGVADLIFPVIGRFDNTIKGSSLYRLAVLSDEDVKTVTSARQRLSEDLHASSETLNPESVGHDELFAKIGKLDAWLTDMDRRQKAAKAPKTSFSGA